MSGSVALYACEYHAPFACLAERLADVSTRCKAPAKVMLRRPSKRHFCRRCCGCATATRGRATSRGGLHCGCATSTRGLGLPHRRSNGLLAWPIAPIDVVLGRPSQRH